MSSACRGTCRQVKWGCGTFFYFTSKQAWVGSNGPAVTHHFDYLVTRKVLDVPHKAKVCKLIRNRHQKNQFDFFLLNWPKCVNQVCIPVYHHYCWPRAILRCSSWWQTFTQFMVGVSKHQVSLNMNQSRVKISQNLLPPDSSILEWRWSWCKKYNSTRPMSTELCQ